MQVQMYKHKMFCRDTRDEDKHMHIVNNNSCQVDRMWGMQ